MIPLKGILSKPDEKYKNTVAAIKLFPVLEDNPVLLKPEEKRQKMALTTLSKILEDNEFVIEEKDEGEE